MGKRKLKSEKKLTGDDHKRRLVEISDWRFGNQGRKSTTFVNLFTTAIEGKSLSR